MKCMQVAGAIALLTLAGCDRGASPAAPTQRSTAAPATLPGAPPTPPPAPAPGAAKAVEIRDESALLAFRYSWPAEAAAIPTLDARLRADARTSRQRALNAAQSDRRDRGTEFPFHKHELVKEWTLSGDAAGLLAITDRFYAFTGGAHGMSGYEFILWDRAADKDITLWSLFRDRAAAEAELVRLFCPALDRIREEKRGMKVQPGQPFSDCPKLADQVLIPSQVRGGAFTAVTVLIGNYEAGPYAEGTYEVPLAVTPRLAALLRPERRGVMAAAQPQ